MLTASGVRRPVRQGVPWLSATKRRLWSFYRAQLFQTNGHALQQQPEPHAHMLPRHSGVRGDGTRTILGVWRVALSPWSLAAEQDIQHDARRPDIDLLSVRLAIADLEGLGAGS